MGKNIIYRITLLGVVINILLGISKIFGGIFGHSYSLIADGIHSISDLFSDFILIIGYRLWSRPRDIDHPYGHKKIEDLITLTLGVSLLISSAFLMFDAIKGFAGNKSIVLPDKFTLIFALISIILKEYLYHITKDIGIKYHSKALVANAWHHRSDAFSSIIVLISLICSIYFPEWYFMDIVGSIVIVIIIFQIGFKFLKDAIYHLTDVGASQKRIEEIREYIMGLKCVKGVHAIRSRYMGSDLYMDLHLEVDPDISVKAGHIISEIVKKYIMQKYPDIIDIIIHIEPYMMVKGAKD